MSLRGSQANRVAIVGASSLRGKEVKLVLEDRNFPADEIILLDEGVMAGTLTESAGEPTFIRGLAEDSFEGIRYAFFAGTAFDAERNRRSAQQAGAIVIDLTGALASSGHVTMRIPSLSSAHDYKASAKTNGSASPVSFYSPSAASVMACTLALGLASFKPLRLALVMYPPVSERDQAGIEELESQTTNLLSFRPTQQTVFDVQVAFNLNLAYGAESKPTMEAMRGEISRDVARYLDGKATVPAVQLVQTPVFYGYAFSAFAEFEKVPAPEEVQTALTALGVKITPSAEPPPSNVSVAGESAIHMAPVKNDPQVGNGLWFWGVSDNLRLQATNSVRIAEELLAASMAN